ncbi:stage II sporulation protein M [Herbiconiux solani]|uniref:stage II sporulation protein M n=1 Tax=Herbiconiux solani TaxID=661329 RepID=UPI000825A113|nr:stage II sporulation protein M [Herbiconiux solani]
MDIDAYSAAHRDEWDRLDELGRRRSFTGREADELIERYQSGSTQLSAMKTVAGSTGQGDRLSVALSRARLRFTGTGANVFRQIPAFFALQLPAALYRLRWLTLAVAVATVLIAALYAIWILQDPAVISAMGSDADLKKFADEDFVNYYSENPAASFTGQVWTNNAWIAAQCVAFGVLGVYVPVVILQNAQNLGVSTAIMFQYGQGDKFFLYILPHGLLELTAIFVAAAAGLRIFWAWVAPGALTRGRSLAENGRSLFTVAIGLVFVLFVSGVVEGFVTPSALPAWAKIAIGALVLAAFLFYMLVIGRRAARAGETGDLAEFDAGATQLVAG